MLILFRESDSINYLKCVSLVLEQMRRLPIDHREIHLMFMAGHFVVQQINGSFNAVSPNMKMEQRNQRSFKASMLLLARQEKQSM